MRIYPAAAAAVLISLTATVCAQAKDTPAPTLEKCSAPLGSIAIVEGEMQAWSNYGLGSPRALINAMAVESGCFMPHNAAGGTASDFLMTVVLGESEAIDKSINMAKSVAVEGLVRSGAAGQLLGRVPLGGQLLGAFGGFGGKKKQFSAGIKIISPASGQTLASGTGQVTKTSISFGGNAPLAGGVSAAGYGNSKDGASVAQAFLLAFNDIVGQSAMLQAAPKPAPAAATVAGAAAAVDTVMRAGPDATAASVRNVRAGTKLKPTGQRQGKFVEVEDGFGSKGWVSVEDLG